MLKKFFLTFFMAAFYRIKLLRLKNTYFPLFWDSSSPNSPSLFVIVFWGSRSSLSQMFFKIGVLKNFANFIGKHQCWNIFLIKLQAWRPSTLLKRDSNAGVFLLNLRYFTEHFFLKSTPGGSNWTNSGYLCDSLCGEVMLWSFSTTLP